ARALTRQNYALLTLGLLVAALTAFYMFRLILVVFFGSGKTEAAAHARESEPVMAWPLRFLAVFSLIGGFIGIDGVYAQQFGRRAGALFRARKVTRRNAHNQHHHLLPAAGGDRSRVCAAKLPRHYARRGSRRDRGFGADGPENVSAVSCRNGRLSI